MEKEDSIKVFAHVDKIVGARIMGGVCMPVDDVSRKKVAVLTIDDEYEQRVIS